MMGTHCGLIYSHAFTHSARLLQAHDTALCARVEVRHWNHVPTYEEDKGHITTLELMVKHLLCCWSEVFS